MYTLKKTRRPEVNDHDTLVDNGIRNHRHPWWPSEDILAQILPKLPGFVFSALG